MFYGDVCVKYIKNKRFITSFVLFLFFEVMLLKLCFWQYARLGEQRSLYQVYEQQLQKEPVTFDINMDYEPWQKVALQGELQKSALKILLGQRQGDVSGVRFLAPLLLSSGRVWLDMGFVPSLKREQAEISFDSLSSTVSVEGLTLKMQPAKGWFKGPVEGMNEGELMRLDAAALGQNEGDIYVQLMTPLVDQIIAMPSAPKDGSKNLEYMLTWALCAAILLLLYVVAIYHFRKDSKPS